MAEEQIQDNGIEVVRAKYDEYKQKTVTLKEWALYLCNTLENWVKKMIHDDHLDTYEEKDELMAKAMLEIIEHASVYNPYRSSPTSYYTPRLKGVLIPKDNASKGMSAYYSQQTKQLNKEAEKYGFKNFIDACEAMGVCTFSVLAGKAAKTILNAQEEYLREVISLDQLKEDRTDCSAAPNPLSIVLRQEDEAFIGSLLEQLTPLELFLIERTEMSEKPQTFRSLYIQIKESPDLMEEFSDELPKNFNQVFLERTVNYALMKMRNSPKARKYMGIVNDDSIEIVEPYSSEDIIESIKNGILEL